MSLQVLPVEVVETAPVVDQLNGCAVAVEVYHSPQRLTSVHAGEEDALVSPVHPEVDVPVGREVKVQHLLSLRALVRERLGPEPLALGQIRAGVFGQRQRQSAWVVGREPHPEDSLPPRTELGQPDADPLSYVDGPIGEEDPLAEALHSAGAAAVHLQADIVTVGAAVEPGTQDRRPCGAVV